MNVIIVDDEQNARENLEYEVKKIPQIEETAVFEFPAQALEYVKESPVDVAFLDVEMPAMSGLEFAKAIREASPRTNIVFVTGYPKYAADAFKIYASGYLLKPANVEDINGALKNLRNPVDPKQSAKLYVQCFGNFEVFVYGRPVSFERSKTKELLAYLIWREGASCTNDEIIAAIWPDDENTKALQGHYRHLLADLIKMLKANEIGDIIIKRRGSVAVLMDKLKCDLLDFKHGDANAVNRYTGEVMPQFKWVKSINGDLITTTNE